MFILASSVSKSLQYLTSTLTQGGEGGHLFKLTCSVVLWEGRNTGNKYHWHGWEVLTVPGPHWVCLPLTACVPFQSTLFRLQVALPGKWALSCMHFPDLRHSGSGSWVLHKGTDSVGPAFCAFPDPSSSGNQVLGECTLPRSGEGVRLISSPVPVARFPGCAAGTPSQACYVSPLGS